VEVLTFPGAGHIPHETHPALYAEATVAFIRKHASVDARGVRDRGSGLT
jgi:hypothetical protein